MDKKRIIQVLMQTGQWKRSEVRHLLKEEKVTVDEVVVTSEHYFVKKDASILVNGKKLTLPKEKIYLMLNKPTGYSCQKGTSPNVLDLVKETVFSIGRLDKYTEGLLLLTNDGDYAHKILSPEHKVEKEYLVTLMNPIDKQTISLLEKGVEIRLREETYLTKPAVVTKINPTTINIIIKEGKKRQIRKMLKTVGNKVVTLTRIRIGKLLLGNLKPGSSKKLSKEEAFKALE